MFKIEITMNGDSWDYDGNLTWNEAHSIMNQFMDGQLSSVLEDCVDNWILESVSQTHKRIIKMEYDGQMTVDCEMKVVEMELFP